MSLIDQHELSLPNSIIDTIKPLKTAHSSVNADMKSYSLGFEFNGGYVELQYVWGIVSLTIVELWPLRIERVHDKTALNERQRAVLEGYLKNNFS